MNTMDTIKKRPRTRHIREAKAKAEAKAEEERKAHEKRMEKVSCEEILASIFYFLNNAGKDSDYRVSLQRRSSNDESYTDVANVSLGMYSKNLPSNQYKRRSYPIR